MSQAIQETLLDHNPTSLEIYQVTGYTKRSDYENLIETWDNKDLHFIHIYTLYGIRENKVKALEYLNKIQDEAIKKRLTEPRFRI